MTADELRQAARQIKHETIEKNNSAIRVGSFLENLVDYFENSVPSATSEFIRDIVSKYTSGIKKGMSIPWDLNLGFIPEGFVLSDGNNGVKINGVTVPDYRKRVPIGYDPNSAKIPVISTDTTENYGAVGNIGGKPNVQLSIKELPKHSFNTMLSSTGNNTSAPDKKEWSVEWSSARRNGNQDYDAKVAEGTPDVGRTNVLGEDAAHENRQPYTVTCWITKVSDDASGSGIIIDPIAGENVKIDKGNPAKPTFSVDFSGLVSKIPGSRLISETEIATFNSKQDALGFTPEQAGIAQGLISDLKGDVTSEGDTLKKLYDLIISSYSEVTVEDLSARDAYVIAKLPTTIFVKNDGDGKWALYKATTTGANANYIKISDPDLLGAVMSASQIATSYESNTDVNRFTNALKAKLDAFTANFTSELKAVYDAKISAVDGKIPLSLIPTNEKISGGTPTLGESYGGGKIFHILTAGETGYEAGKTKVLIVALEDATSCVWAFKSYFDGTFWRFKTIGTTLPDLGEGQNNSNEILAFMEANANPGATLIYAAEVAKNYNVGGFTDGYLPSQNELAQLSAMHRIGSLAGFLGTVNTTGYWSSTESGSDATYVKLNAYGDGTSSKDSIYGVRAIRMAEYGVTDGVVLKSKFNETLDNAVYSSSSRGWLTPAQKAIYDSAILNARTLKKLEITGANGIADDNGVVTGTTTYSLDPDTDFNEIIIAYDGGAMAFFSKNSIAKTITFATAPYTGNIITILYYKKVN